jgi:hypothetical protein
VTGNFVLVGSHAAKLKADDVEELVEVVGDTLIETVDLSTLTRLELSVGVDGVQQRGSQ